MQTIVWHVFRCVLVGNGEEGVRTIVTIVMAVLMFTPSVLLLFNVNDAGPNVNGVILQVGVFVNVNVLNTLTLLVD